MIIPEELTGDRISFLEVIKKLESLKSYAAVCMFNQVLKSLGFSQSQPKSIQEYYHNATFKGKHFELKHFVNNKGFNMVFYINGEALYWIKDKSLSEVAHEYILFTPFLVNCIENEMGKGIK